MCGRLVNLDTVARVLADYYHLKTETQLAALDEALSKVPAVSDLPSEQPVEDASAMCGECDAWNQYKNYPHPGWIPCSERLPEAYADVLVWFEYYRYGDYNRLYQMHGIGTYIKEYDSWIINHETGWRKLRVFAWMPLPAPWKGEKE